MESLGWGLLIAGTAMLPVVHALIIGGLVAVLYAN